MDSREDPLEIVSKYVNQATREIMEYVLVALRIADQLETDNAYVYIIISQFHLEINVLHLHGQPQTAWTLIVIGIIDLELVNAEIIIYGYMVGVKAGEDAEGIRYGPDKTVYVNTDM